MFLQYIQIIVEMFCLRRKCSWSVHRVLQVNLCSPLSSDMCQSCWHNEAEWNGRVWSEEIEITKKPRVPLIMSNGFSKFYITEVATNFLTCLNGIMNKSSSIAAGFIKLNLPISTWIVSWHKLHSLWLGSQVVRQTASLNLYKYLCHWHSLSK